MADAMEFEEFEQILVAEGISKDQCADITALKVGEVIDMYIACQARKAIETETD